jgi:2-polyprenyl-3-methyl-5-hydroxy-6-metoxy-1,4-benzoquinol methylase
VDSSNIFNSSNNTRLPLQGLETLYIGCGGGLMLSESLARVGATVTGIDPSERLVAAARQHVQLDSQTRAIHYVGGQTAEDLAANNTTTTTMNLLLRLPYTVFLLPGLRRDPALVLKGSSCLLG